MRGFQIGKILDKTSLLSRYRKWVITILRFEITVHMKNGESFSFYKSDVGKKEVVGKLFADIKEAQWIVFDGTFLTRSDEVSHFAIRQKV